MKKTGLLDSIRNIGKEKISFISIIIISMLAVTAYLGINFGASALEKNADKFYKRLNFRDIEITSTKLLSENDLTDIAALDCVEDVEGVRFIKCKINFGESQKNVNVVSLTDRINILDVVEGTLPTKAGECAIEDEVIKGRSISVGDTITICNSKGEKPQYMLYDEYVVTAIVHHPDNYAHTQQVAGERDIIVTNDSFDVDELQNCFMRAEVKLKDTDNDSRFSIAYKNKVSDAKEVINDLAESHQLAREEEIKKEYESRLSDAKGELDENKKKLDDAREELDESAGKISDGEKELSSGKDQLADAEKKIEDGEKELSSSKKKLDDAKKKLDSGKKELDSAKSTLDSKKAELDDGKQKLDEAKVKLDDGFSELVSSYNSAIDAKSYLITHFRSHFNDVLGYDATSSLGWSDEAYISSLDGDLTVRNVHFTDSYTGQLSEDYSYSSFTQASVDGILAGSGYEEYGAEIADAIVSDFDLDSEYHDCMPYISEWESGYADYKSGLAEYNEKLATYNSGLEQYNDGLEKYESGLEEYEKNKKEYEDGLAKYEAGEKELESGKKEYDSKKSEYEDGEKELEDGKKQLEQGEKDYESGLEQYNEGLAEYEKYQDQYDELGDCYWIVVGDEGNGGFVHAESAKDNMSNIGMTFSLLFVIIGALVIYVTVGRIIGEQRHLVGVEKALGFFDKEVLSKYLIFGVSATLLGVILGTLLGYFLIQGIVVDAHNDFYVTSTIPKVFRLGMTLIITLCGVLLSGLSVFLACTGLLKKTAILLLKDEPPKVKKKKGKNKESKGSLLGILILRNITSDLSRVIITVISIAGCCILLVIGFTIQDAVNNSIDKQFDDLLQYTNRVIYETDASETAGDDIGDKLNGSGIEYVQGYQGLHSFMSPEGLTFVKVICSEPEDINKIIDLKHYKNKDKIVLPEHGAIITRQMSEIYNYKVGDTFTVYDSSMNPHEVEVAGVYEYYFDKQMFMSPSAYKEVFGTDCQLNSVFVSSDIKQKDVTNMLSPITGYSSVESLENTKDSFMGTATVLTLTTTVLIVFAGIMAFFIIMNLINMYLNDKKKELTIMRINGYTTKEVIRYVATENIVTTILGIILGLLVGSLAAYLIIKILEGPQFGLIRTIDIKGWIFSSLITAAFALVVNWISLRKVKNLKLSDTK